MISYSILHTPEHIQTKVTECAAWIDKIVFNNNDTVLCPVLQSSFMFLSDVCKNLNTLPTIDFCGINNHDEDGLLDELYMYKGVDTSLYDGKTAIILDVLCSSGTTIDFVKKFITHMGAKRVYTASLICRQFSKIKPDWYGFVASDELLIGYGMDYKHRYRTLNYIAYV